MIQPRSAVDLHIHTPHSDGTEPMPRLLQMLRALDAGLVSFTDHDSVGAYGELAALFASMPPGLCVLPGVELTFLRDGLTRDLLGYGIDIAGMDAFLQPLYAPERMLEKQRSAMERMKENCRRLGLRFDPCVAPSAGKKSEAYLLMHRELNRYPENAARFPCIVDNTRFFWDFYANPETPFYVDETAGLPTLGEAVAAVHRAGGLAFLAHPCAYGLSRREVCGLVRDAVCAGVDGLEVFHSSHREDDALFLRALSQAYGLFVSGGSDFHGHIKPDRALVAGSGGPRIAREDVGPGVENIRPFRP